MDAPRGLSGPVAFESQFVMGSKGTPEGEAATGARPLDAALAVRGQLPWNLLPP
jgi:hypothetical protein